MFQIFQVTKINFDQYLKLHKNQIHIIFNATLPHKLKILPSSQNLFRELYPIDLVLNSKNKILHHIGTQMNVTQLTKNFKMTLLKLPSTTILCTNHILRFPLKIFNQFNQSIAQMTSFDNDSDIGHMNRPDEQIAVTTSKDHPPSS